MPCKKKTTKKYSTRPSPPYPAGQCCIGSKRRGNSGSMYVVTSNVNRVKRWVKVSNTSNTRTRKTSNETGRIRRKSLRDGFSVTFKPYYTRPRGRFIFYDKNTKDFRSPSTWGTELLHGKSAALLENDGWKIWVVEAVPEAYSQGH